jgi:hypothetical protein
VQAEGDVFAGLEAVVLPGTYRTSHPKAVEVSWMRRFGEYTARALFLNSNPHTHTGQQYLGKPLPKPPKARPGSASASSASSSVAAAGTPIAAPVLEVAKDDVCRLLAKHGA